MKINNWKMFLESLDDNIDPELVRMKKDLLKGFEDIFKAEDKVRKYPTSDITYFVNGFCEKTIDRLVDGFLEIDNIDKKLGERNVELLSKSLNNILDTAKGLMIRDSFKEGVNYFLDKYIHIISSLNKINKNHSNKPSTQEVDYSEMTNKEIRDEIDIALDERDFTRVKELSQYLKESVITSDLDVDRLVGDLPYIISEWLETITKFVGRI